MKVTLVLLALVACACSAPPAPTPPPVVTRGTNAPTTTSGPPTRGTNPPTAAPTSSGPGKVLEVAEQNGATAFSIMAQLSSLRDKLKGDGPYTVFAPTDAAIEDMDQDELRDIIQDQDRLDDFVGYHIGVGEVKSSQIVNDLLIPSCRKDVREIRMNIYPMGKLNYTLVTASGSPVQGVDKMASNGVVHLVKKVVYPAPRGNIAEELALEPQFSRISEILLLTNHGRKLGSELANITFFVPTNTAIGKIKGKDWRRIVENLDLLEELLRFHSVNSTYVDASLYEGRTMYSFDNNEIAISEVAGVKLANGAPINPVLQGLATNGAFHGVDTLMFIPVNSFFNSNCKCRGPEL